jgi:uncharacterized membrane protein SpoIIM required for sporulation
MRFDIAEEPGYLRRMDRDLSFQMRRQKDWRRLEELADRKDRSFAEVREMGRLYQAAVEDLSLGQTRFPDSDVTLYLNHLVRRCHGLFAVSRSSEGGNFLKFFTTGFPGLLARLWVPMAASAVLFTAAIAVSYVMVVRDTEKAQIFLQPRVYDMAMRDLEERRKFGNFDGIPKEKRVMVTGYVWMNNSMVSLYCFTLGVTVAGTFYILVTNGFMLGALFGVYHLNGQFLDFFSLVMVHGSIELVAIVLAAGAGLWMASALLFPGRRRRSTALKENGLEALGVFGGAVALLFVAGLLEGFVTPAKPQVWVRLLVAGLNTAALLLYFLRGFVIARRDRRSRPSA